MVIAGLDILGTNKVFATCSSVGALLVVSGGKYGSVSLVVPVHTTNCDYLYFWKHVN
jgi:hypothetical protein